MAKLFEIDQAILECIDPETGEIIDIERLSELQLERNEKIKKVAQWYRNLQDDAESFKANKEYFAEKEKAAKNKAESLKNWLDFALAGNRFEADDKTVAISYRKSEVVEIAEGAKIPKKYQIVKTTVSPDKNAIKAAIKSGIKVKDCKLVEKQNIQIK